jgi:hypothetical protein
MASRLAAVGTFLGTLLGNFTDHFQGPFPGIGQSRPPALRCFTEEWSGSEIGDLLRKLAPQAGLEPATLRLTAAFGGKSRFAAFYLKKRGECYL